MEDVKRLNDLARTYGLEKTLEDLVDIAYRQGRLEVQTERPVRKATPRPKPPQAVTTAEIARRLSAVEKGQAEIRRLLGQVPAPQSQEGERQATIARLAEAETASQRTAISHELAALYKDDPEALATAYLKAAGFTDEQITRRRPKRAGQEE